MTTSYPPSPPPPPAPPANHESETLEYRREAAIQDIAPSVVAMLNKRGGSIYVGYADDGTLLGVGENAPALAQRLTETLSQVISPKEVFQVLPSEQNGRTGLVIEVPPGVSKPYVFDGRIYVRVGGSNRPATADMISRMIGEREKTGERWERRPALGVEVETLNLPDIWRTVTLARARFGWSLTDEEETDFLALLERLDLAQTGWPTQAAAVLFQTEAQRRYPQASARAVVFADDTMTRIVDDKTFGDGAFVLFERLFAFLQSHLPAGSVLKSNLPRRVEITAFPIPVMREAIVNALMHRDYDDQAHVQVSLFPDRLEIWNPGALPPEYGQDTTARTVSRPRNPDIARIFHLRGYAEMLGIGLWRIRQEMAQADQPPPEWRNEAGGVRLTLRRRDPTRTARGDLAELLPRQAAFLAAMTPGQAITREEYQSRFAPGVSERSARNDLQTLLKHGYLQRTGQGYYRAYVRTGKTWKEENEDARPG